jgi:DNA replication and repair protein RecF
MRVNGQAVQRIRDLHGLLRITVFAPDDLQLVKGGPALRRGYLDDLLAGLSPRYGAALTDLDRVLRQRNALLKQARSDRSALATLPVFDEQLIVASLEIVRGRVRLVERLATPLADHYRALGEGSTVEVSMQCEWTDEVFTPTTLDQVEPALRAALERRRANELDRQATLVGPHRDELVVRINDLDARTQASQGEQRSMALALRLAGHAVTAGITGAAPVLLLDDVFSELDVRRAAALVALLPPGQTLLSTATEVPAGIVVDRVLEVAAGTVRPA